MEYNDLSTIRDSEKHERYDLAQLTYAVLGFLVLYFGLIAVSALIGTVLDPLLNRVIAILLGVIAIIVCAITSGGWWRFGITAVFVICFVWFLIVSPIGSTFDGFIILGAVAYFIIVLLWALWDFVVKPRVTPEPYERDQAVHGYTHERADHQVDADDNQQKE